MVDSLFRIRLVGYRLLYSFADDFIRCNQSTFLAQSGVSLKLYKGLPRLDPCNAPISGVKTHVEVGPVGRPSVLLLAFATFVERISRQIRTAEAPRWVRRKRTRKRKTPGAPQPEHQREQRRGTASIKKDHQGSRCQAQASASRNAVTSTGPGESRESSSAYGSSIKQKPDLMGLAFETES